ncbi:MAG TPA: VOC family protein [Polyangia bacterium]|jgi:hypothetical protein
MPNPFVHIELTTGDVKQAKQFYRALFDWKLTDQKMGPGMVYTMIDVGKGTGGGLQAKPMPDAPTGWLPYVEVEDVKKTLAKAEKKGAKILLDYHEIPGGMGSLGIFLDPTGAMLGVWAAAPKRAPARKPAAKKKR